MHKRPFDIRDSNRMLDGWTKLPIAKYLCGTLSSISMNYAWSFLGIKLFATVEAKEGLLISVLIELSEVLTLGEFFGGD
ncbi:unnamed protein product [Macrosiphum euphorbiae]|uniref:Uncharacterized protein n=1 Tax=Macrosiphum euphorbiae TaxID=13131 RepID=A0AAV0VGQ1_9HEMI|nr:unnamed protein product [Macrosiphum euphorbiae]